MTYHIWSSTRGLLDNDGIQHGNMTIDGIETTGDNRIMGGNATMTTEGSVTMVGNATTGGNAMMEDCNERENNKTIGGEGRLGGRQ